jgi:hypothetical protein
MIFSKIFKTHKDIYLASYPRSGNTWIRVLMGYLYFKDAEINSLMDLQQYIPDEHLNHRGGDYKIDGKFRIIKTHNLYVPSKNKKAIYLYRNPVDVAWSYYNFLKDIHHLKSDDIDLFVESYLNGKIMLGSWDDHVISWSHMKTNILFISYESLVENTLANMMDIVSFVGIPKTELEVQEAIIKTSPEVVKKITDDEVFYGVNKPNFVRSPLNSDKENKKIFVDQYSSRIMNEIKLYDFSLNRLRKR